MLSHLHIQNFAIAPELELEFEDGFTVITGETGAGKSILVDALGLLLGERSDVNWVRHGAERAQLSAEFSLPGSHPARAWLEEAELSSGDSCLLRRSITDKGRSRAWINGTPVTVSQLGTLGRLLVEIHGQNEHLDLIRPAQQLQLLDRSGRHDELLDAVCRAHSQWHDIAQTLDVLESDSALTPAELDLLRYQHSELSSIALSPEALETLEQEHQLLSRQDELSELLNEANLQLTGDERSLVDELHRLAHRLSAVSQLDERIREACVMLEEAAINTQESATNLARVLSEMKNRHERLDAVRIQLSELGDLARKHRVDLHELPDKRDELNDRLRRAESCDEQRIALQQQLEESDRHYRAAAISLSEARNATAKRLSREVTVLMQELGMEGGVFHLIVSADPKATPLAHGMDRVSIEVSANPGMPPGSLAKIASGGELSRLSLAIKVAARSRDERIQIFDEVDAGIGGDTANIVGRQLARLSAQGQAFCVTHLAQVAVCADHQIRVAKLSSNKNVTIETALLEEDQRVVEIARMLSGRASKQSLAHARELLTSGTAH